MDRLAQDKSTLIRQFGEIVTGQRQGSIYYMRTNPDGSCTEERVNRDSLLATGSLLSAANAFMEAMGCLGGGQTTYQLALEIRDAPEQFLARVPQEIAERFTR